MIRIGFGNTVYHHCSTAGHLDGIGVYTQELGLRLQTLGVEALPVVFARKPQGDNGGSFFSGKSFPREVLTSALFGVPFSSNRKLKELVQLFHATDHHIPKFRGIPVIATIMDPIPLMRPDWVKIDMRMLKNHLFRKSARWADHYITISQFVAADIAEYFRIPMSDITPIHLGVDAGFFAEVEEEEKKKVLRQYGLKRGFFLFIGTLQPRKNIGRLIEAFRRLPRDLQKEHPLVVAGRNGWSVEEEIRELQTIEAQGIGKWLDYIPKEHKRVLLQSAGAFVFPSLYEGFGLPVLEAFASGIPVITSNSTSLPEVAGNAALLIDPYSIEELSAAMQKAVTDTDTIRILTRLGCERARNFTWDETARRTVEVYKQYL